MVEGPAWPEDPSLHVAWSEPAGGGRTVWWAATELGLEGSGRWRSRNGTALPTHSGGTVPASPEMGLTGFPRLGVGKSALDRAAHLPSRSPIDGAGAHANLSGVGVVAASDRQEDAIRLLEFLVQYEAQTSIAENGEFPANPQVEATEIVRPWQGVKLDPISASGAGQNATAAVTLMQAVGWE